jgi:hypothetical protein
MLMGASDLLQSPTDPRFEVGQRVVAGWEKPTRYEEVAKVVGRSSPWVAVERFVGER